MNETGTEKEEMDTPALLIDLDVMEKNISAMARFFKGKKASLWPHIKVHRTPMLAHKQVESGAGGICCQKVRQAEIMAESGIRNILLTNIVATPSKVERLVMLAKHSDILAVVDDPANAELLSKTASKLEVDMNVLADVNVRGAKRFGVEPGEPALKLAKQIVALRGLSLRGLMGNVGDLSNIEPRDERRKQVDKSISLLLDTKKLIERSGIRIEEISTGSTGTYDVCAEYPDVTQVRAGSYILMDHPYHDHVPEFDCALTVLSTVISKHPDGILVLDAGMMSISSAYGNPKIVPSETLEAHSVELLELHSENALLKIKKPTRIEVGDKVELVPSYLDATLIRHETFCGMRKGQVELIGVTMSRNASI
jgi:D-serine deaminase-like pyridoxal phosphate-dependent protein